MKIALYITDNYEQIVLTPEGETEEAILEKIHKATPSSLRIERGSFYHCQGGYVREGSGDESTLFVLDRR